MKGTYDINKSYDENYAAGPYFVGQLPDLAELNAALPPVEFLGKQLNSTLGIPAGPLLNSAYIKLYADLGFDVLTYKTVRTGAHPSHPFPNVRAVATWEDWFRATNGAKPNLTAATDLDESQPLLDLSITNSFGMPSKNPAIWREDIAVAKAGLNAGQMLVVSVVGTAQAGGTLADMADDFGQAAAWAAEAGADAIEANLSCPNVKGSEGSLYQSPVAVKTVAAALHRALGNTPFLLKMGFIEDMNLVEQVVSGAKEGGAAGIAAINTIPANVYDNAGAQALPGDGRLVSGICGAGIKPAGLKMSANLLAAREKLGLRSPDLVIVGVGGVMTAADALEYLQLGADGVQSGTGAMWQPHLAADFKRQLKYIRTT